MNKSKPAIVIVAYNRPHSLKRVLSSISNLVVSGQVPLVISIDNGQNNPAMVEVASSFEWSHGPKEILARPERMGLRNHVLSCGDLTRKYGSIIMLEDDLYASPWLYKYVTSAFDFYADDDRIAGISAYALSFAEANKLPFTPLADGSDIFFKQMASSFGQAWTEQMWSGFRSWLSTEPDLHNVPGMPHRIANWSASSWKKYFIGYLVETNRYFVFPRVSYTTNFNDPGENMIMGSLYVQVPLQLFDMDFKWKSLDEAPVVYDAWSEIETRSLDRLTDRFKGLDYELDLYGEKQEYAKPWVITTRRVRKAEATFGRLMKPHELNLVFGTPGNDISLARREDIIVEPLTIQQYLRQFGYFYTDFPVTGRLKEVLLYRLGNKLRRMKQ